MGGAAGTTGSVFAGRDEENIWEEIARHLPTVLAVETLEPARGNHGATS